MTIVRDAVIVVIGASGGLGAPTARLLAERGSRVILAGRDLSRLAAVGLDAPAVQVDLRDPTAGDVVVAAARAHYGRLDGVINAAGVVAFGPLTETDDVVIEELFLTNVLGPLWLAKRVAPALAETGGFLLNVSAIVAETPMPGMAAYSASKAALSAGDLALTRELRRLKVRVIDARPPHTETGLATRPLAGTAPPLPQGLEPERVAARLVAAIEDDETDIDAKKFAG